MQQECCRIKFTSNYEADSFLRYRCQISILCDIWHVFERSGRKVLFHNGTMGQTVVAGWRRSLPVRLGDWKSRYGRQGCRQTHCVLCDLSALVGSVGGHGGGRVWNRIAHCQRCVRFLAKAVTSPFLSWLSTQVLPPSCYIGHYR